MDDKKIVIIGSGALGTAFSNVLLDSGNKNVVIYGIDEKELSELKQGKNTNYFEGDLFIHPVKTTNNIKEALDGASYVVLALPSTIIPNVIQQIQDNIDSEILIISGSKGF